MNLKLDFKKLSSFKPKNLSGNISIVLWLFELVMLLLIGWVMLREVRRVTGLSVDTTLAQSQVVRVEQEKYQQLETRLQDNERFSPEPISKPEAFTTPVEKPAEE